MKSLVFTVLCAAAVLGPVAAYAGPDDAKWVAQCVSDNQNEKAAIEVITKYCTCMDNKMSDNETQSITQWEKTHLAEQKACDQESGWK